MSRLGLPLILILALGAQAAETPEHEPTASARPRDTESRPLGEVKLLFPGALDEKIERCSGKVLESANEKSRTLWVQVAEDCPGKGDAVLSLKEAPRLRLECLPPKGGVRLCRAEIDPKVHPRGDCLEAKLEVVKSIEASERPRLCSPRRPTPTPTPTPSLSPTSTPTAAATPVATRIASRAPTLVAKPSPPVRSSSDPPGAEAGDSDRGEAPKRGNPKGGSTASREATITPPAARTTAPAAAPVEGRPPPPVPTSATSAAVAITEQKAPPPKKWLLEKQLPAYEPDLAPPVPTRAATSEPVAPPPPPVPIRTPSATKAEAAPAPEKSPPRIAPPQVRAPAVAIASAPVLPPPPFFPAAFPKNTSASLPSIPVRALPKAWSPPSVPRSVPAVRGGSLYDDGIGSPFLEAIYGYSDHE